MTAAHSIISQNVKESAAEALLDFRVGSCIPLLSESSRGSLPNHAFGSDADLGDISFDEDLPAECGYFELFRNLRVILSSSQGSVMPPQSLVSRLKWGGTDVVIPCFPCYSYTRIAHASRYSFEYVSFLVSHLNMNNREIAFFVVVECIPIRLLRKPRFSNAVKFECSKMWGICNQ